MFKLLKDLTRAPEPLNRPPPKATSSPHTNGLQPYVPRQRSRSPGPSPLAAAVRPETEGAAQSSASKQTIPDKKEEPKETDEDALRAVELIKTLDSAGNGNDGVMIYVEVSHLKGWRRTELR